MHVTIHTLIPLCPTRRIVVAHTAIQARQVVGQVIIVSPHNILVAFALDQLGVVWFPTDGETSCFEELALASEALAAAGLFLVVSHVLHVWWTRLTAAGCPSHCNARFAGPWSFAVSAHDLVPVPTSAQKLGDVTTSWNVLRGVSTAVIAGIACCGVWQIKFHKLHF